MMRTRQQTARDVADMLFREADITVACEIAQEIAARGDKAATAYVAAIYLLSEMLDSPSTPPGAREVWFEAVVSMLREGMQSSHEMGQRAKKAN